MKKHIILSAIFTLTIFNVCRAQNDKYKYANAKANEISNVGVFIFRLTDGTEKITRDPIALMSQVDKLSEVNRTAFFEKHKDIIGGAVFTLELKPIVKNLMSLDDILEKYDIKKEDRAFDIVLNEHYAVDRNLIFATPGSIESVKVNYQDKVILIKAKPDNNK